MKTITLPQFHIDGRYAAALRRRLGLPAALKDLDEETTTGATSIELSRVGEMLHLPPLKYVHLTGPDAFLCGGALTAWIGGYPTSDYDFFFPDRSAAQRFHEALLEKKILVSEHGFDLLNYNIQMDGYQGSDDGESVYEAIKSGELRIDELANEVIDNEEIRALNYSIQVAEHEFDKIQIVLIMGGDTPAEVIDTFDFTISMLGTDGKLLYFSEYTWTDLFRRRLRTHNIHHGISTMRRMVKYSKRGFYACVGTMYDIAQGVIDSPTDQPISVD